uniref:CCHC-type domain-containing protein n=1 Tax=Tanacetum cinerariifolium TaxID=118510 RepID=A0A6L2MS88_TANCI|nr:hypothetical protein [Tanacetum cinerariifolium]
MLEVGRIANLALLGSVGGSCLIGTGKEVWEFGNSSPREHKRTCKVSPCSLRSIDESVDEGIPKKVPRFDDEEADIQRALEESLKSVYDAPRGPLPPVALDLLTLQTPKKKSHDDQFIFQRRTSIPTESFGHGEFSSLYAGLTDSEIQDNKYLEKRLDSHESRLHILENLDIPQQVSKAVDEIVTDAVDWAIQAPLQNRFRDLPEADMKEILHQRIWETNSYKAQEDHMMSLPHQPPPPSPPTGPSGTSGSPRASGSSQVLPPPPSPLSTNQEGQSHGSTAPSSLKTAVSAEYKAWTMTDTRIRPSFSLTPADLHMNEDIAPDAQIHSSDDEDIRNAYIPKVNLRQDWWKPFEEDIPATSELAWSIPSSDVPVSKNNWASALASTYSPLPVDSLLAQTGDMAMFMDWHNVSKPLPLGGLPGQVTIQSDFFFNKDLEYLRYSSKGNRPALSISKMKATYYHDVSLEQMVPDQMWIEEECKYDIAVIAIRTHMRILSVLIIKVFSMYGYDYMKTIVLRRVDLNEHIIAERDFKYLYPSDFEDLYLLNLQVIDSPRAVTFQDKYGVQMIIRFNKIHKFGDGTLHQIDEALDYRVEEFKVNRMNLVGFNSLVHSLRALSTLRRSGLRMASVATKPCQGDSLELYLITGSRQDNAIDEDVDEQPVQDLALNVDNVFQADDCDAFDSDVDEAPTAQTMFMANLSSVDPVYDAVGPSYDSNILSEVHDHDHYQDVVSEHHEEHTMHDNVQLNYVVYSHVDYTSDSNMIPYDQYVKDNSVSGVHSNVSSVLNDNIVVKNSLTAKLTTYKEQVELYERRARFELTEREQKINEQLRIVITNCNFKEEMLKKELHSLKLQLASTINHNKLMVEEVTSLKKDFKQKENKYLEYFLDIKSLKEKVKDRLFKQDQSLQIVHMLCRPKPYCNELNKRITPTGLTEEEMGFEQTKECYFTGVIPFFKTLKEHFEGIQKALTKEIKEMNDVFEELEAEVAQNVVDRKHDEIEQKNLLTANDNLIAECLSKEVFSVATQFELNVARFTKMHVANTIVEARCLELKAELSTLRDKRHNDNHNKASKDHVKPTVLAPRNYAIDVEPIPSHLRNNRDAHLDYLRHLKENVETIRDIVEDAKVVRPLDSSIVSAYCYTKPSQELLEYAIGVNRCTDASELQPRSITKKNRISSAKCVNKMQIKEQLRTNKSHLRTMNRVDSSSLSKSCSKHMTRDRSWLMNFVKKFIKIVTFGNDHFGAIMGYGDYVIGDSVISRAARIMLINANTSNIQKGNGASQKATCYECGNQGHYKRVCPGQKNQNHENQIKSTKARGVVHAFGGGETEQDFNNIEDEIEA